MQVEDVLKDLEIEGTFTAQMKEVFVNEATKAIKEQRPFVWMYHSEGKTCRGDRQKAYIGAYDPTDPPGFRGWIKYFVGNGGVIDPDIMKKPAIPGAF